MKTAKSKLQFASLPKDYAGLCRLHLPRPLHDRVDLDNTTEIADAMAGFDEQFTPDQEDYFDLLCRLIEDYEKAHVKWPRKKLSGPDRLRHLLAENKMTAADLARLLGVHRTLGAMILRGERQLTVSHIKVLASRFAVSGDLFL